MIEKFLAKEPSEGEQLIYGLAHVAATYFNFASSRGSAQVKLSDFLLFRDPWAPKPMELFADERYTDLDREIFKKLT